MDYTEIQGWFDFAAIYDFAVREYPSGVFVEIGAWKGKSTAYLASKTRYRPIALFVVDTWKGSGGSDSVSDASLDPDLKMTGGDMFDVFLANMDRCGLANFLKPLRMRSSQAATFFTPCSVDFCFIDGAHDYASVKADLATWLPKIRHGGTIAGHDYSASWPGVVQAVNEFFPKGTVQAVAGSWLHRKS